MIPLIIFAIGMSVGMAKPLYQNDAVSAWAFVVAFAAAIFDLGRDMIRRSRKKS